MHVCGRKQPRGRDLQRGDARVVGMPCRQPKARLHLAGPPKGLSTKGQRGRHALKVVDAVEMVGAELELAGPVRPLKNGYVH